MGKLRAALKWVQASARYGAGARLVAALDYYLAYRHSTVEGFEWAKRMLDHLEDRPLDHRPGLFIAASWLGSMAGKPAHVLAPYAEQAFRAARLTGASEAMFSLLGPSYDHADQVVIERKTAAVKAALGEDAFSAAFAEGYAMTPEEAADYALAAAQAPL
ncbi:MAG: hypothetical protein R3300_12145 [Candidatus Promineifilaceae bacterium]|nr:hypothetical protein [Candidatus Promineifilaceae bacterium]